MSCSLFKHSKVTKPSLQPNRVYFRPALINIGYVLCMCLGSISCIASQYQIDILGIKEHKRDYLTAVVDTTL
jgi:hypothetical protein